MGTVNLIMAAVDFSNYSGAQVHAIARPAMSEGADAPADTCGPRGNHLPNLSSFVPPPCVCPTSGSDIRVNGAAP